MLSRSTPIVETSLRGLHPRSIDDTRQIRALLERARASGVELHRGLNTQIDLETARIEEIDADTLVLRASNFARLTNGQVFLNFTCGDRPYFFATTRVGAFDGDLLRVRAPETIYYSERRDRLRHPPRPDAGDPLHVSLGRGERGALEGEVEDVSPSGFGVLVHGEVRDASEVELAVELRDAKGSRRVTPLVLRNAAPAPGRPGWTRIGLARASASGTATIPVEERDSILDPVEASAEPGGSAPISEATEPEIEVLRISNREGEEIVSLVDGWGDARGATAVIVTPGWGQTKEALLPVARTLVASFAAHGTPVRVLRVDGIRKRGESHNDPECRVPGREHHHFVFSQGADDIATVARHLRTSPRFEAAAVVVVSFSAGAIEARKALARDEKGDIDGWVSVVGAPDMQSMVRSISGGVDFAAGYERGLRFGTQELLGVVVDIDRMGDDAVANAMLFIEDARRDMASIDIPITWYHGRYDAWIDLDRVRDVLSHGDLSRRSLVVVPTGHQVKSSRQASETFQCIARDVARMALGEKIVPVPASTKDVRRRRLAEHARLPERVTDIHQFWHDYLVGRDDSVGIELLASGSAYRSLMRAQIESLDLRSGDRVVDLGSGTGSFELELARAKGCPKGLRITALDYVREALARARERLSGSCMRTAFDVEYLEADLNLMHADQRLPLQSDAYDGVLASLLISYLDRPEHVLAEVHRVLRPGGRLIVSSLRRDADFSRLWVETLAEFQVGQAGRDIPGIEKHSLDALGRNFLNDAARILDLEDQGAFHFWEPDELAALVREAGFVAVEVQTALGEPPQASIVSAERSRG